MRANEFIIESNDIDESAISRITTKDAKRILAAMRFSPTGRRKGSHDVWKDLAGILFTIPMHGKELEFGVTKNLLRIMRDRGINLPEAVDEDERY